MNNRENVRRRTRQDILSYDKIVLWGAGFACPAAIDCIGAERISAVFDNDSRKWGSRVSGVPVLSPGPELEQYKKDNCAFVISTNGYEYEIARELINKWGIKEDALFCNTNKTLEECRYRPDMIEANWDRIMKVRDLLADQESRAYYMDFITACYTRNPLFFKGNPRSVEAYEYNTDLAQVGLQGGENILDCGAFNGDTARIFLQKTNHNCEVYCFEPVVENCNEMRRWIEAEGIGNVHAYNVGVGDTAHTDIVYSTEARTTMAAVGNNRFNAENPYMSQIQVDTLDHMAKDIKVGYIKMDIEGAEMSALRGAQTVIRQNSPQMLISGYHRITDMWEVPEYVLGLVPEYKIFLGHQPHVPYEPEFLFV